MEKRKTNLTIEDFEDKKYGAGKRYTRFNTDQGWISCFDKPTIEKLKDSEGKCMQVEITTDDDDREKITKVIGEGVAEEANDDEADEKPKPARKSVKGSAYEKDPVGLAVECFVAMSERDMPPKAIMTESVDLVKQAQKAFE